MIRRRADLFHSLTARALAILLLTPAAAVAQDVTEPDLKAAFIYNFAKFTEWPVDALAAGARFTFCVIGDATIGEALERVVKNRTVAGHSIDVSQAEPHAWPLKRCHIAYVSRSKLTQAVEVVAGLRDAPVLTISDAEGFTQQGGIARFYFEHGQLRFDVHIASAKRARLQISSKLLALARIR